MKPVLMYLSLVHSFIPLIAAISGNLSWLFDFSYLPSGKDISFLISFPKDICDIPESCDVVSRSRSNLEPERTSKSNQISRFEIAVLT